MYARLRCGGNLSLSGIRYRSAGCAVVARWLGGWHSVPERATYGTEYACRAQKGFLGYATHLQRPAEQPTPQTVDSLLGYATHFRKRAVPKAALAAPAASSVRETASARRRADINRVGGKRSSFLPTFVFRPLTPPYMRFRIRRFLFWMPFEIRLH